MSFNAPDTELLAAIDTVHVHPEPSTSPIHSRSRRTSDAVIAQGVAPFRLTDSHKLDDVLHDVVGRQRLESPLDYWHLDSTDGTGNLVPWLFSLSVVFQAGEAEAVHAWLKHFGSVEDVGADGTLSQVAQLLHHEAGLSSYIHLLPLVNTRTSKHIK